MKLGRRGFLVASSASALASRLPARARAAIAKVRIDTPMAPPRWALLQRELIAMQVDAAKRFHARYFDSRHFQTVHQLHGKTFVRAHRLADGIGIAERQVAHRLNGRIGFNRINPVLVRTAASQ